MQITARQLKAIMPNIERNLRANVNLRGVTLDDVVKRLNFYAGEFGITEPLHWAHYLAQIAHESGEFRYTEEIASGTSYEGRKDLGNTQKGDGVKFKGRGLIQLTGRGNYTDYRGYCGYDVVKNPKLLAQLVGAIRSSMWYFVVKAKLLRLAEADDLKAITKKVNGGYNGYEMRKTYCVRAKEVLNA